MQGIFKIMMKKMVHENNKVRIIKHGFVSITTKLTFCSRFQWVTYQNGLENSTTDNTQPFSGSDVLFSSFSTVRKSIFRLKQDVEGTHLQHNGDINII